MQHDAYFAALGLQTKHLVEHITDVHGSLIVLRKPLPALAFTSSPVEWEAWLMQDVSCPFEMLHTVTGDWQSPTRAHCYGWIINASTEIRRCPEVDAPFVCAEMTDREATKWLKQLPHAHELLRSLQNNNHVAKMTTVHYHPTAKVCRLRAAVPIPKGTYIPEDLAPMYAYDARGIRSANVSAGRVALEDIKRGQPLVVACDEDEVQPAAKRARTETSMLTLCVVGAQRRLCVAEACPGSTIELPLDIAEKTDVQTLYPYSTCTRDKEPGLLAMRKVHPGWQVDLLLEDGSITTMALSIAQRRHARLLNTRGYDGKVQPLHPVGRTPPLAVFVDAAPTDVNVANIVLADIRKENEVFVFSVPLDKVGVVYSKNPKAAKLDEMRKTCVPQRINLRHSVYAESMSNIHVMHNSDAMDLLLNKRSAPHIVKSHLFIPSTRSVPPLPLRLGPNCYIDTGLCAELLAVADEFLRAVTEPWGAFDGLALSNVRCDVETSTGLSDFPSNRGRQLWLKARNSPSAPSYAMLGYVFDEDVARKCAAVAVGHVDGHFIEKRAGAHGPLWPACILKISTRLQTLAHG